MNLRCTGLGLALVASVFLGACAQDIQPNTEGAQGALETEEQNPTEVEVVDHGEVDLLPPLPARNRQRMNLDQLAAAIDQVSGGLAWTEGNTDLLTTLAATLGKPDYREVIMEDLTPSPIFQKFLDDAARDVCQKLVQREMNQPTAERFLMLHVDPNDDLEAMNADLDANLVELLLRFHGKAVTAETPELVHWRWLVTSIANATQEPIKGWHATCVALMTHPDFYTY